MTDPVRDLLARVKELDGTLIENAASAIYEVRDDPYDLEEWGDLDSAERERYECDARAALEAVTPSTLTLARALEAVLEVHGPYWLDTSSEVWRNTNRRNCEECDVTWPCDTVRAITEHLGGEK